MSLPPLQGQGGTGLIRPVRFVRDTLSRFGLLAQPSPAGHRRRAINYASSTCGGSSSIGIE